MFDKKINNLYYLIDYKIVKKYFYKIFSYYNFNIKYINTYSYLKNYNIFISNFIKLNKII